MGYNIQPKVMLFFFIKIYHNYWHHSHIFIIYIIFIHRSLTPLTYTKYIEHILPLIILLQQEIQIEQMTFSIRIKVKYPHCGIRWLHHLAAKLWGRLRWLSTRRLPQFCGRRLLWHRWLARYDVRVHWCKSHSSNGMISRPAYYCKDLCFLPWLSMDTSL